MTRLHAVYLALVAAFLAAFGVVAATIGSWWSRRAANAGLRARDAEIRRQQAELNATAGKAALDKLRQDIEGINHDAVDAGANPCATISKYTR